MFRRYLILLLSGLILYSCQEKKETGGVEITGTFPALAGEMLYVEEMEVRNTIPLDSILLPDNGHFSFHIELLDAGFYVLRTTKENHIILQLEKCENVKVSSSATNFSEEYNVEGSVGSVLYQEFDQFMAIQKLKIDSLAQIYYDSRGKENFLVTKAKLDSIYLTVFQDQKDYMYNFVDEHPASLVSLIIINSQLGNTPVLDEEEDFPLMHTVDSVLRLTYPDNKHVIDNQKRVKEIRFRIFDNYQLERKLLPGKKAPDIVLPDTANKPFSLKSYMGKKVIVYFWAGWNAKSRQDNRRLAKLHQSFMDKNIEMIGVSLDENAVVWKGAIKLDQLQWLQLSDLVGFKSEIKKAYNVPDDLPYYYVLDEKHIIMGKSKDLDEIMALLEK